ncbi:hypothetical protein [Pseudaestuariivita sp.]|uniref:hypothetical protein n=1 Tax=Pseudaestuariivita sp. TaxID=2211669 RepID=UPI0040596399
MPSPKSQHAHDADTHRAALTATVADLWNAAAPRDIASGATADIADAAHRAAHAGARAVKGNGAALALIGAGIAMMVASQRSAAQPSDAHVSNDSEAERLARADAQMTTYPVAAPTMEGPSASRMSQLLDKGLDALGPDARARVIDARRKALDAQTRIEEQARKASAKAVRAHDAQPLVTGLAAAGLGALIGGLLPSTRREDALMGHHRDRLMRDAEALLHHELDALKARAQEALSDAAPSKAAHGATQESTLNGAN